MGEGITKKFSGYKIKVGRWKHKDIINTTFLHEDLAICHGEFSFLELIRDFSFKK